MILAWSETGFGQILYFWDKRNKKTLQSKGSSRTACTFCIISFPGHGGSGLGVSLRKWFTAMGQGIPSVPTVGDFGESWEGGLCIVKKSMHEAVSVSFCPLP